jgi:hypothetical protein
LKGCKQEWTWDGEYWKKTWVKTSVYRLGGRRSEKKKTRVLE